MTSTGSTVSLRSMIFSSMSEIQLNPLLVISSKIFNDFKWFLSFLYPTNSFYLVFKLSSVMTLTYYLDNYQTYSNKWKVSALSISDNSSANNYYYQSTKFLETSKSEISLLIIPDNSFKVDLAPVQSLFYDNYIAIFAISKNLLLI